MFLQPYLHESRHLHALKRARGSGGRFLNTKQLQESKLATASHGPNVSGRARFNLNGNMSDSEAHHQHAENYRDVACTTSYEVTSASNSNDMFQQHVSNFRLSSYPSHIGRNMQGFSAATGGGGAGNQHRVSVLM